MIIILICLSDFRPLFVPIATRKVEIRDTEFQLSE